MLIGSLKYVLIYLQKQVLLEEFTGNTCGFCPDGDRIADELIAAHPEKVFVVSIHADNTYAAPASASNSLDFRTSDGDSIFAIPNMAVDYWPSAAINRRGSPDIALIRYAWSSQVDIILSENTYVNVAGQAYLNPITRQLLVNVEAYYTSTPPVNSNKISLALIQNNIIAYQYNGDLWYPAMVVNSSTNDYRHNYALRDIITSGATGELMTGSVAAGTTWSKTYTYTVPATYPSSGTKTIPAVLGDLELVAFISETYKDVVAVCKVPVTITTGIINPGSMDDLVHLNTYPNPMANDGVVLFTLKGAESVIVNVVNTLGETVMTDNLNVLDSGEHKYNLDATRLSNGIYFLNVKVGENTLTKKIAVLK